MKGYALQKRDKPKDAYDIYYVVKHYPDGLEALAEFCRPLLAEKAARDGFEEIAKKFDSLNSYGADTVRDFLRDTLGSSEEIDLLHRDAYAQVNAWVRVLGLSV
jgi:ubiquinone/menaquinone biosynthesis C-methylase UbiE